MELMFVTRKMLGVDVLLQCIVHQFVRIVLWCVGRQEKKVRWRFCAP